MYTLLRNGVEITARRLFVLLSNNPCEEMQKALITGSAHTRGAAGTVRPLPAVCAELGLPTPLNHVILFQAMGKVIDETWASDVSIANPVPAKKSTREQAAKEMEPHTPPNHRGIDGHKKRRKLAPAPEERSGHRVRVV